MQVETRETKAFIQFLEEEKLNGAKQKIDDIFAVNRTKPGSIISVLQQTQKIIGYLPPVVHDYVAEGLNIPSSDIYGIVSFYSFFTMKPRGKHLIRVCLGTACYVKGASKITDSLHKILHISPGETTKDRQFSLEGVRCLGACGLAPVVVIDDETYGMVELDKVRDLLQPYMKSNE